ncbi:cytosolic factor, phosphatidylinositol/phosphatidylcholine transfer protein [Orbilia javanica]|uniref:Cytosolic factor, phosphatidylinositol/phosphatidylcholine transfer protein n=1 Tax=Orbilia javanica TaxID=47235 RepID=A0AAN8MZE0_9PEZI
MSEKYDDYNFPHTHPDGKASEGHPGNVNGIQGAQVHQLRAKLEAQGYTARLDTNTLLRYLRARKFDVNLAEAMFIKAETWRKDNDIWQKGTSLDDIVATWDYPEKPEIFKHYPQYYHKTDKDGRPVYIEQLGKINLTAMGKITSQERMLTNLAVEYERVADPRLPACSRKVGRLLETCCTIMDLKGVGVTTIPSAYGYLKRASAISQDCYPERLGKLYIINAPWGFSTVWGIISGWLDPVTVQKIKVLGSGYASTLLEQIPAENLPVEFGGTCKCEGGCPLSDAGPWNEPEYLGPFFKSGANASGIKPEAAAAAPAPEATA